MPLINIWKNLQQDQLSLVGTLISFVIFLLLLPSWFKIRWQDDDFYSITGLIKLPIQKCFKFLSRGLILSLGLLCFVLIPILFTPWGSWLGVLNLKLILNAFVLGLGVGFAEEMVFRGWLLTEMNHIFGNRLGLFIHAVIFSLSHLRLDIGLWPMLGLLIGLFLLGLVLALIRKIDKGILWGPIGLHSGLVGGWFVVSAGLVEFSPDTPVWLFGPGGSNLNPIGGGIAIFAFAMILFSYRTAFAKAGRPFTGARNASSRGASP